MQLEKSYNLDRDENENMITENDTNDIQNPIEDFSKEINPLQDSIQEQMDNNQTNIENAIDDENIDQADKLPNPCALDLENPETLASLRKLQDMTNYFEPTTNTTIISDKNKSTNKITENESQNLTDNFHPPRDTNKTSDTNTEVIIQNREYVNPIKDNTTTNVSYKDIQEQNKKNTVEIPKQVSSDDHEDTDDSESEDEEDIDNTFSCIYHKTTTAIMDFNKINKGYMKKNCRFYKDYGEHGCRVCKNEFSNSNKGTIALHCKQKKCYYAICPSCHEKASKELKNNTDEIENKRSSKRRKQSSHPVIYAEGNNNFFFNGFE